MNNKDDDNEDNDEKLIEIKQISKYTLQEYKVINYIDSGMEGVVFHCECEISKKNNIIKKEVALKILYDQGLSTLSLDLNLNEFKILSSIPFHKNIIQLLSTFVSSPTEEMLNQIPLNVIPYFIEKHRKTGNVRIKKKNIVVLEYINKTLDNFLYENPNLSINKLVMICKCIGEGLNFLYNQNVIHRDIKLDNILIDENECPKISDFGYAIFVDENKNYTLSICDNEGGNKNHLAPEILNSYKEQLLNKNKIFDISYLKQPSFEFGVICHEVLVGEHPFNDYPLDYSHPIEIKLDKSKIELIEDLNPKTKEVICSLLNNDPNERPLIDEVLPHFEIEKNLNKDKVSILSLSQNISQSIISTNDIDDIENMDNTTNNTIYYVLINKIFITQTVELILIHDSYSEALKIFKKQPFNFSKCIVGINDTKHKVIKFYGNFIFKEKMLSTALNHYSNSKK